MGRIDEAIKRSGSNRVQSATAIEKSLDEVFVSPWMFREGASEQPVPAAAAPRHAGGDGTLGVSHAGLGPLSGSALKGRAEFSEAWIERLVIAPGADHLLVEQFRQLAATLHHAQTESNIRVVMVTSAGAGEGKSFTTVNLALTLSDSYRQRVLLIDADLRRPSLHEIAQVPGTSGLGDTLKSSADQKLPVYSLSNTLTLVPAGKPDPDPMRALTSRRMQQILAEAATRFDWVLIDAPPIGPIVDASLLAPNIDAAILVVRADHAHYTDVRRAVESLGRDRIIGVVLNGIDETERAGYQNYSYAFDRTGGVRQA